MGKVSIHFNNVIRTLVNGQPKTFTISRPQSQFSFAMEHMDPIIGSGHPVS